MKMDQFLEKKDYRSIVVLSACLSLLSCIFSMVCLMKGETVYVNEFGEMNTRPNKIEFCKSFSNQIVKKKLLPVMTDQKIYEAIVKSNYRILEFDGTEEVFNIVEKENGCEVSLKDSLGMRVFSIGLGEDNKYKSILYSVKTIKEIDSKEG